MATDLSSTPTAHNKKAPSSNAPNSFRIFLDEPELGRTVYPLSSGLPVIQRTNVIGQPIQSRDSCSSCRQATKQHSARVLCGDVKIMMQPVCDVLTDGIDPDAGRWWLHRSSGQPEVTPPKTLDTTSRNDFQYRGSEVQGNTRFAANCNRRPARGIIPANWMRQRDSGYQRFLVEDISYEHEYNSRADPNYPTRGKRQGNLIWRILPDGRVDQMLCKYGFADSDVAPSEVTCRHICPPRTPSSDRTGAEQDRALRAFLYPTKCFR